jgi:putative DNA methylase
VTYNKKLIEVALPLMAISEASAAEKTLKNSHPANLHMWWARRPLAAARAVVWASLVDDPSAHPDRFPTIEDQALERKHLFDLLEHLVQWEASDDQDVLHRARQKIAESCGGECPTVLDPFGGGGAIPLESLRLGLPTITGDLNPVAVLIQRLMLQAVPRFANTAPVHRSAQRGFDEWAGAGGLARDLQLYGRQLLDLAHDKLGAHYPQVVLSSGGSATPIAWIWARTVKSPDPAFPHHVPLVKSWILAKKPGKPTIHVSPEVDPEGGGIRYEIRVGGEVASATVARGVGRCLATGAPIPGDYIKAEAVAGRLGTALLAVAAEGHRSRVYEAPSEVQVVAADVPEPPWLPSGAMSDHPQYMGTPRYGLDEWWKLFTPRQLLILTSLVDGLDTIHANVRADAEADLPPDDRPFAVGGHGPRAYADAVCLTLMCAIDKLADLNNSLARWEPVAQCPRQLFGRQAVQMTWDYAEANPFSSSSGSFMTIVEGIARTLDGRAFVLPRGREAEVQQRDAESRVRGSDSVVVSTDPPYYDNVPYSDLSDFFYVWMRRGLAKVFPDDVATLLAPKADELVADQKRLGSRAAAHQFFESKMSAVFSAVSERQDARFPATFFYAFKAAEGQDEARVSTGWSSFLASMISAGLAVTATWPIRTENASRLRGLNSNALASSVVLACRPRPKSAVLATRGEFVGRLRTEIPEAVRVLQEQNIAPVDLAQSSIGPGIAIFSEYLRVVEADGSSMGVHTALGLINEILAEVLSGEESEFDADTRFALTWFEQYGHNPGPFGDADLLARAKDTTVTGVAQAGLVLSRDGKVRLFERKELSDEWDPATDNRLTVWETAQYLIRSLESSESDAATLLARMGEGLGERARQLAYLLYGICDRKKWADEAGAYNMLVTAWPEISRLAAAGPGPEAPEQLF